jgi:hypothetical protein
MKKTQKLLKYLEFGFFIFATIIVIIFATGIRFDFTKKEFVQTGVLKIENLEDESNIFFKGDVYENKNSQTIYQIDEGVYPLRIEKKQRKDFNTNINIKKNETTYINPILVPNIIKSTTVSPESHLITSTDKSLIYLTKENNKTYLEKLTVTPSFFSIDTTKSRIEITDALDLNQISNKPTLSVDETNNLIGIYNKQQVSLINIIKASTETIYPALPLESIKGLQFKDNYLIVKDDQNLYSIDINNTQKAQRFLIFTGTSFTYTIDDTNNIIYIMYQDKNDVFLESYTLSGNLQIKKKLDINTNLQLNSNSKLYSFNKSLYLAENNNIYKISNNSINQIYQGYMKFKFIDRNTIALFNSKSVKLIQREKEETYTNDNFDIVNLTMQKDLFSMFYTDTKNRLHIADLGGQDNIISENVEPNFIVAENGSDTSVYFNADNEIKFVQFGND